MTHFIRLIAVLVALIVLILALPYLLLPQLPPEDQRGLCTTCHWGDKDIRAHRDIDFTDDSCLTCHNPHTHFGQPYLPSIDSCLICHFEYRVKDDYSIHKPVEQKQCISCHQRHVLFEESQLVVEMPMLCNMCHYDEIKRHENPSIHEPYEKRQCLSCHDAHMSPNPVLFRQPVDQLCYSCHRMTVEWHRPVQHDPFEIGMCLDCHVGHASPHKGLTKHDQITLCYSCHYDRGRELSRPFKHEPYGAGRCTDCHEPHSSVGKNLLPRRQLDDFCYMCHSDIQQMAAGGFSHADAFGDKSCAGCHEHHSAHYPWLLRTDKSGNPFCFTCHDFPYYSSTAHFGLLCSQCHSIHGSPWPYFIRQYELDLCNQCHEGFIHRSTNHPVGPPHWDILRNRALLCSSCHDPHGTPHVKLTVRGKNSLCISCHDEIR